ncbi:MAG: protein phosphatase 2C domain-containing protein [Vulcanimicrobiota bacterium]
MDSPFSAFRLPQDRETSPTWVQSQGLRWRYAFARAAETRAANDVGQDCVVLSKGQDGLSFCVTDGVSQSFFGDLAAAALADDLVDWLAGLNPEGAPQDLHQSLTERLNKLCLEVTQEVQAQPLPAELPGMLRQVLEQKRSLGSESMYACGRIWLPQRQLPEGYLIMSWLGDVRCRIWRGGQEVSLEGFRTENRWSSARGILGSPGVFLSPLTGIQRLAVYSDGLEVLDGSQCFPDNENLARTIAELSRNPKSDDVSLVEVLVGLED